MTGCSALTHTRHHYPEGTRSTRIRYEAGFNRNCDITFNFFLRGAGGLVLCASADRRARVQDEDRGGDAPGQ